MNAARTFRDLRVYQLARAASLEIFEASKSFPREDSSSFARQICIVRRSCTRRRCAIDHPKRAWRRSNADHVHLLKIDAGSRSHRKPVVAPRCVSVAIASASSLLRNEHRLDFDRLPMLPEIIAFATREDAPTLDCRAKNLSSWGRSCSLRKSLMLAARERPRAVNSQTSRMVLTMTVRLDLSPLTSHLSPLTFPLSPFLHRG